MPDIQPLLDFFSAHTCFVVIGHLEPDGDCITSQLVLSSVLERKGKKTVLCNPGPFDRHEISPHASSFITDPSLIPDEVDAVVVVDCSSPDRIADFYDPLSKFPLAVIDHHSAGDENFGSIRYVDSSTPAATLLIKEVVDALGLELTKEEAELLFLGLATDTGFFRYLSSNDSRFVRIAADFIEKGASPRETYARIYHGKPRESRTYLARALERTEYLHDGRIALTYQTVADRLALGRDNRDSDALYASLLAVDGVEVIAVIKEEDQESCTVSFRSTGTIDVGSIALEFGGGGHHAASGCKISAPLSDVLQRVRTRLFRIYPLPDY